jgi:hypothetical protein
MGGINPYPNEIFYTDAGKACSECEISIKRYKKY